MDHTDWLAAFDILRRSWKIDVVTHGYLLTKLVLLGVAILVIARKLRAARERKKTFRVLYEKYDTRLASGLWVLPLFTWAFETPLLIQSTFRFTCSPLPVHYWIFAIVFLPLASLFFHYFVQFFLVLVIEGPTAAWNLGLRGAHKYVVALVIFLVYMDLALVIYPILLWG